MRHTNHRCHTNSITAILTLALACAASPATALFIVLNTDTGMMQVNGSTTTPRWAATWRCGSRSMEREPGRPRPRSVPPCQSPSLIAQRYSGSRQLSSEGFPETSETVLETRPI